MGVELVRANSGFSLIELMVVLLLLGLVSSLVLRVGIIALESHRLQASRAQLQSSLRLGVSLLASELRELGGDGLNGGDVVELDATSITYRAMRNASFLCRSPDSRRREIVVWAQPSYGLRRLEANRDSVLIFAENDPVISSDNEWLRAAVVSRGGGSVCPGGRDGVRLGLVGVPGSLLTGVQRGAPVRGFQVSRLLYYEDRQSTGWLGLREWRGGSGWSVTQPVLGPLAPDGLRLEYLDATGRTTERAGSVAVIAVTLVAQSAS
ncbi:MAG: prepilin-type N-terminal cleavage/methylation domain-containing protein, partial [Gemmatimonadota bacterium]